LVLGPDEGSATNQGSSSGLTVKGGGFVFVDEFFVWKIIDLDTLFGTDNEPVKLGGEQDNVNWGFGVDLFEMSSFNQVPDVDFTVSTTGGDEVGVWCEIKGVDLSFVSNESVLEGHDGVIPNLDGLIPGSGDDDWFLDIVEVSDAGNPVGVLVLVNGELADTVDVPNLEVLIDGTGGNLSIVWGEGNREDIFGVTNKSLSGLSGLKVPESDGSIPGGGKAESAILGDIDIGDEVGMSGKDLSGFTKLFVLITLGSLGEVPKHESAISGSGKKEFSVLVLGDLLFSDLHASNPSIVSFEVTSVLESVVWLFFCHCDFLFF
jgi:hypothetical protein